MQGQEHDQVVASIWLGGLHASWAMKLRNNASDGVGQHDAPEEQVSGWKGRPTDAGTGLVSILKRLGQSTQTGS